MYLVRQCPPLFSEWPLPAYSDRLNQLLSSFPRPTTSYECYLLPYASHFWKWLKMETHKWWTHYCNLAILLGLWHSYMRGAKVSAGKKTISQRKNLPIECAQGDQLVRCPDQDFCAHQLSAVPSRGGVLVLPWPVGGGDVMCCDVVFDVMWLAARWGEVEVVWLVARCHVMWRVFSCLTCHVM